MAMPSAAESHAVEVIRAESGRYRHPLLMIHGTWTGGWIWAGLAGYLAHRGWDAWVPTLSGADAAERRRALVRIVRDLAAPPVLVTHDTGFATALDVADLIAAPAIVAVTPLARAVTARGPIAVVASWAARFGMGAFSAPAQVLAELPANAITRLTPDSAAFHRAALAAMLRPVPITRPAVVVATKGDRLTVPAAAEDLARRSGCAFDLLESAGHFPMLETGFERLGDHVHRWIVRTLGEPLLELFDDENQAE
jgi:predicted alpha/beta hydrolase family esterase